MMLKKIIRTVLAVAAFTMVSPHAMAKYDSFNIMIISGPGSGQDLFARAVADVMRKEKLASGIQIDPVIGGGGTLGIARFLQNGPGEGNSVFTAAASAIIFPLTNKTEFSLKDMMPLVRLAGDYQCFVVAADSDIKTLNDLIAKMKKDPGSVPEGGSSPGSYDNITFARFADLIGVDVTKINHIPHANTGEVTISVLSRQVAVGVGTPQDYYGQVKAGKLRYLAIAAPERVAGIDAPTFKELGIDLVAPLSRGFYAHPGITAEQKAALEEMFAKLAKSESWKKMLSDKKWEDQYQNSSDWGKFVTDETEVAKGILTRLGFIK
jgi:putative tricarboxylic transport membrane protein